MEKVIGNCCEFHKWVNDLPRFSDLNTSVSIPDNGVCFVFERGEKAHKLDRIVQVGTHTGENKLKSRLYEHIHKENKDRSIFRKHIGRCFLADDPFLYYWNIDLTTRKNKQKYSDKIDPEKLKNCEEQVTSYIKNNLFFATTSVAGKTDRLCLEKKYLSTITSCSSCIPSSNWLGLKHQNPVIRQGLWNIQGC